MAEYSRRSEVISVLKAILDSAQGGIALRLLQSQYKEFTGDYIPLDELGYKSLQEMLTDMKDVVYMKCDKSNEIIVHAVVDEKTAHIAKLVSKQKSSKSSTKLQNTKSTKNKAKQCNQNMRTDSCFKPVIYSNSCKNVESRKKRSRVKRCSQNSNTVDPQEALSNDCKITNEIPKSENINNHKCPNRWTCEICMTNQDWKSGETVQQPSLYQLGNSTNDNDNLENGETASVLSSSYSTISEDSNQNNENAIAQALGRDLAMNVQQQIQMQKAFAARERNLQLDLNKFKNALADANHGLFSKHKKYIQMKEIFLSTEKKLLLELQEAKDKNQALNEDIISKEKEISQLKKISLESEDSQLLLKKAKEQIQSCNRGLASKHEKFLEMEDNYLLSEQNLQQAKAHNQVLEYCLKEKEDEIMILKKRLNEEECAANSKLINEIKVLDEALRCKDDELIKFKESLGVVKNTELELQGVTETIKHLNEELKEANHTEETLLAYKQKLQVKLRNKNKGIQSLNRRLNMKDKDIIELKNKLQEVTENCQDRLRRENDEIQSLKRGINLNYEKLLIAEQKYESETKVARQKAEAQNQEIIKLRKCISELNEEKVELQEKLKQIGILINLCQDYLSQIRCIHKEIRRGYRT